MFEQAGQDSDEPGYPGDDFAGPGSMPGSGGEHCVARERRGEAGEAGWVECVGTPGTSAPSGSMAFELAHATLFPSSMSAAELIDAVIGYDRVVAWATARQQVMIAEFHRRPANGSARPESEVREWAGEEIALALTLPSSVGASRVAAADRLDGALRPTRDLLEAGRITPDRARLITDMLWGHDDEVAAAVQQRVLPRAPESTWGQLRSTITRAILAVVPDVEQLHRRARRERRVDLDAGQDGMATLSAFLTAAEATASFEWVTRLARGVRPAPGTDSTGAGRGRGSMDRRRADVLVALLTGRLTATTGDRSADDRTVDRPTCSSAAVADSAGATPTGATPTGATTTGATTTVATDVPTSAAAGADPDANDRADDIGPAGVLTAPVSAHRPLIHVTIPLSTLLGLDDEPAELAGYGPLPAAVAREIAADPNGTWRRLLTDPVTGRLLDHGRTVYRPPAGLAGFIRTRDGTCRHPGCRRPAVACELDHVQPWAQGGATSEDNVCALCERHHDLKEQHGWQVVLHDDRSVEWITPTGHRYRSRPVVHPLPPLLDPPLLDPAPPDPAPASRSRADPFSLAVVSASLDRDEAPPF